MTETNQNQNNRPSTDTSSQIVSNSEEPESSTGSTEQSDAESTNQRFLGIPMPLLLAILTGLGTALGAVLTSAGEVLTSYLEFDAQFRQGRQEFEFELIREALEVQNLPQDVNENETEGDDEAASGVIRFAQDSSSTEEDASENLIEQNKEDRLRAAQELEFYADIGIIKSLDAEKVREWATEREEELPRLQSTNSATRNNLGDTCFFVDQTVSVYSAPSFDSAVVGIYPVGSIAFTTSTFEAVSIQEGTNEFILMSMFDGNLGWVPRSPAGSDVSNLIALPPRECANPESINASLYRPSSDTAGRAR
ncbi:hypothetical protein [Leptolyngbya iicbica]|uniref:SH3 domain-containing protein n=2 Tax=Cyanophyceae TaxID=3028117 RepID=A0A4Q7E1M3_9CYAN|nr:hypothetical protein [Leptolyngbya sp. LK]RZM75368.1 hypothetical protein DYY88_20730 [Leptolyngbya sp. LK]